MLVTLQKVSVFMIFIIKNVITLQKSPLFSGNLEINMLIISPDTHVFEKVFQFGFDLKNE